MKDHTPTFFDVVIIGGGNAGISAAARLIRKGIDSVAVIEPQQVHTYRPLLSYVGGGQASLSSYDGYTVAPVTVDAHRLIAGEFDRTGAVSSSLPSFLDPLAPRRIAWAFDRYVLPRVYWNSILKGRL